MFDLVLFDEVITLIIVVNRNIKDDDMNHIVQLLKQHCNNLEYVYLSSNLLTSKGIAALFDGLVEMERVRVVDVSGNEISDDCMQSVANFIKESPVTNLSIDLNGMSDSMNDWYEDLESYLEVATSTQVTKKSIEILHSVLIGNVNMKEIYLSYQVGITDECVPLLKEIAEQSGVMIDISWTTISQENIEELEGLFSIPVDDRKIPMASNSKSASKSKQSN